MYEEIKDDGVTVHSPVIFLDPEEYTDDWTITDPEETTSDYTLHHYDDDDGVIEEVQQVTEYQMDIFKKIYLIIQEFISIVILWVEIFVLDYYDLLPQWTKELFESSSPLHKEVLLGKDTSNEFEDQMHSSSYLSEEDDYDTPESTIFFEDSESESDYDTEYKYEYEYDSDSGSVSEESESPVAISKISKDVSKASEPGKEKDQQYLDDHKVHVIAAENPAVGLEVKASGDAHDADSNSYEYPLSNDESSKRMDPEEIKDLLNKFLESITDGGINLIPLEEDSRHQSSVDDELQSDSTEQEDAELLNAIKLAMNQTVATKEDEGVEKLRNEKNDNQRATAAESVVPAKVPNTKSEPEVSSFMNAVARAQQADASRPLTLFPHDELGTNDKPPRKKKFRKVRRKANGGLKTLYTKMEVNLLNNVAHLKSRNLENPSMLKRLSTLLVGYRLPVPQNKEYIARLSKRWGKRVELVIIDEKSFP